MLLGNGRLRCVPVKALRETHLLENPDCFNSDHSEVHPRRRGWILVFDKTPNLLLLSFGVIHGSRYGTDDKSTNRRVVLGAETRLRCPPPTHLRLHFATLRTGFPFRERPSSSKVVFAERMRVALAMIAHVQVVVEKLAGQHGGPRRRRQAITYLEFLKALSRLLLLACSREMVTGGGVVRAVLR